MDPAARIKAMVAAGNRADAVRYWMTDVTAAPPGILARMENSPAWPALQALAHTLPYDLALGGDQGIPVDYLAKITVPALVLGGARQPGVVPAHGRGDRRRHSRRAAGHGARVTSHKVPPEVIAPLLTDFFPGRSYDLPGQAGHRLRHRVRRRSVAQTIAITGGHVVPIEGDPVDGGTVLLRDGKIAAVEGPGFAVPDGAEVVDATGKWVLPGFIDAHAHAGVAEEAEGWAGQDTNERTDPISAQRPRARRRSTRLTWA